ncbi:hypothetical protein R2103_11005 [Nitrosomonas sp. Is24]|uniref:TA system antitoxin ParD family protein n=1 Tax=Nitrosomonas sp. Is24 TaxID=3080533 RepID=UPI00294B8094|nr:hypothetical protein [Nitrosomonas sp. Is24]MDV6342292.1 hypothetical protein [Nitrosomonas sp. Is24]
MMAKAASPIRLQDELMQAAALTAERFHRSTAEQIEYWAEMGRNVDHMLNPDDLLAISAGLARITIEPITSEPVDPIGIFQSLEDDRASSMLPQMVTGNVLKYQASLAHPGYLEQIHPDGRIQTGKFQDGEFIAIDASQF